MVRGDSQLKKGKEVSQVVNLYVSVVKTHRNGSPMGEKLVFIVVIFHGSKHNFSVMCHVFVQCLRIFHQATDHV